MTLFTAYGRWLKQRHRRECDKVGHIAVRYDGWPFKVCTRCGAKSTRSMDDVRWDAPPASEGGPGR